MTELLAHSPLGGSGTHRWMHCPGSVRVGVGSEDSQSEHAALGTAAHALAQYCLSANFDTWEMIGTVVDGKTNSFYPPGHADSAPLDDTHIVDQDMANAVQVYLDAIRSNYPDQDQGNTWIERKFHCPEIHPQMYGRSDFVHLEDLGELDKSSIGRGRLHVWDYKHGVGIVVEVENNPQLMYYAAGMLHELKLWDQVDEVVLWVAQPRGFHRDGPIRSWTIRVDDLCAWIYEKLVPAMNLADQVSRDGNITVDDLLRLGFLNSGEHCRFCPARFLQCPKHVADMKEMKEIMDKIEAAGGAPKATNKQVGRFLNLFEVAKIRQKAFREIGYVRAQDGHTIPGQKLVKAKAFREWKPEADAEAKAKFGLDAMTTPALKSPAQMEKLPEGKKFAAEYAFKPEAGLQLVLDTDSRPEAGPKGRAMFKPVKKGGKK